ncbi:UNVERIFIED_CONTAM: hypothetical protein DES50_104249 [Williamsia faeni]
MLGDFVLSIRRFGGCGGADFVADNGSEFTRSKSVV